MAINRFGFLRSATLALAAIGCMAGFAASPAVAGTIGVAVDNFSATRTQVGATEVRSALGGVDAIKYYIPLAESNSGVYGVTPLPGGLAGMFADFGNGGGELTMNLEFTPVSTTGNSTLNVYFEDLDLSGANDPNGFFESLQVFDSVGDPLTGLIQDIGGLVTGDSQTQHLALDLGVLATTTFFVQFKFNSVAPYYGYNTPEYLFAQVTSEPASWPVPSPGTLVILGTALASMGFLRRWAAGPARG